jgi:pimeloyl-ACP methyl ester carboxylesterase
MFSLVLAACSKDDEEDSTPVQKYTPVQVLTKDQLQLAMGSMVPAELAGQVKYGIEVYKYEYDIQYKGKNVTASGLVAVPDVDGGYPMLSMQHGTLVTKSDAPSENLLPSMVYSFAASLGYVVVIPDLIGFGSTDEYFHPYLVKEDNVLAISGMIDAVTQENTERFNGVVCNDSLFLAGYSQGGWLTLAQMEYMEQENEMGKELIAVSCGAGPYNAEQVMLSTFGKENYEKPFYLGYVFMSFKNNQEISSALDIYFQEPYASKIPELFNGVNTGDQIDAALTTNMNDFYQPEFVADYSKSDVSDYSELKNALDNNRVKAWENLAPIFFTHGQADNYIPAAVSDSIFRQFEIKGSTNNKLALYPELDHTTAAIPAMADGMLWFQEFRKVSALAKK